MSYHYPILSSFMTCQQFATRVTWRVPHKCGAGTAYPFRNIWVHPWFLVRFVLLTLMFSLFCTCICRSVFVCLSFFFWPLYCLSFFDLQLLIPFQIWYLQTFFTVHLPLSYKPLEWPTTSLVLPKGVFTSHESDHHEYV